MAYHRLQRELTALERRFEVHHEHADRTITVENVGLPDGFSPRTVTVRIELPEQWPAASPRLKLPWTIRFDDAVPRPWLTSGRWLIRAGHLGDPFVYYPESKGLEAVLNEFLAECTRCAESAWASARCEKQSTNAADR